MTKQNHITHQPASFLARLLATCIDSGIVMLATTASLWHIAQQPTVVDIVAASINALFIVILPASLLYLILKIVALYRYGISPGKWIVGMRVTTLEGNLLTWKRAYFRETITKAVSGMPLALGYFAMLWHPEKLTWHDRLAGSVVEDSMPRPAVGLAVLLGISALNGWLGWQAYQGFVMNTQLMADVQRIIALFF
jgi:uncharacterized RDD family membrane protein YckC